MESGQLLGFTVSYRIGETNMERQYDASDSFWSLTEDQKLHRAINDSFRDLMMESTEIEDMTTDLIERLRTRALIRRNISSRKSVQEGRPDRIADLLDEAADEIIRLGGRPATD